MHSSKFWCENVYRKVKYKHKNLISYVGSQMSAIFGNLWKQFFTLLLCVCYQSHEHFTLTLKGFYLFYLKDHILNFFKIKRYEWGQLCYSSECNRPIYRWIILPASSHEIYFSTLTFHILLVNTIGFIKAALAVNFSKIYAHER